MIRECQNTCELDKPSVLYHQYSFGAAQLLHMHFITEVRMCIITCQPPTTHRVMVKYYMCIVYITEPSISSSTTREVGLTWSCVYLY